GYHWTVGLSWVDALVEASMILSGMGPISTLPTTSAKIFASLYALFSGLVFVLQWGLFYPPLSIVCSGNLILREKTGNLNSYQLPILVPCALKC
ncbi:MAG: hypothetical protein ACKO7A_15325, partial [Microcystis sp.]